MSGFQLSGLDLFMVAAYTVLIIVIGVWVGRKTETSEDYFLAGRSLIWPIVGFSLFASNISSSTLIGLSGAAYSTGIAVYNYEWMAVIVLILFIFVFLPFYLRSKVYTMPEFLERRFDQRSRYYMASIVIVGNVLLETAGGLYAAALVVQLAYPGIELWQSIVVLAVLAGAYTAVGGLKAVVYTDTIQAVLLLIGSVVISVIAFNQIGSWAEVTAAVPAEKLSLVRPLDDPNLPWLGLITGVPLLGIYFWCNNQFMVQRTLGSKSLDHGRWGGLFAGLLKVPVLFIMVLPGTFAILLYPTLDNPDLVFPTLLFDLLPTGIRGLMLVALVAAIMSSIDSTLNAVSTMVTIDFVKKLRPETPDARLVRVGQIATIVVMVLGVLWAPQIARFENLWDYLQEVLAYISPPIVACFLIGIFWKRANGTGAFAGLLFGFFVGMPAFAFRVMTRLDMNPIIEVTMPFLYVAPLLFLACSAVIIVVSLMTAPPSAEAQELVWTTDVYRQDTEALKGVAWYKNYRILSVMLLVLTLAVVFWFR
ncbi:MAG: sodium:solute symporter [Rhodothermales bacterium]|nr:sodium:solute symporter [Rhodothermales bacterium]MBO6780010.1 sodium:solute symporter [Rhodothermales bacterium]